ncbi:hypothetical protein H8D51_01905 [bacterium]|nr:hypothetical protein [bacterium]
MLSPIRKNSAVLSLALSSLLLYALPAIAQSGIETQLNLGGPVITWHPDPLAQGYSIDFTGAPDLDWQPVAVMADNKYYPDLYSGFFRVTPLYSSFLSFSDTLHFQVKATCSGWTGPQGQDVVDLHDYTLDLIDASYADTLRYYPDENGWTLIPIRDDKGLTAGNEIQETTFASASARDRFSFRLNATPDDIAALFDLPEDLRLQVKPALWFLFQAGNGEWENIVAGNQLAGNPLELRADSFHNFPGSWYDRTPATDNEIAAFACHESKTTLRAPDEKQQHSAAIPDPTLPVDLPSRETWLTRSFEGVVVFQQRIQWTADLLATPLALTEVIHCFEFNTQQYISSNHTRLDRIRGPPQSS